MKNYFFSLVAMLYLVSFVATEGHAQAFPVTIATQSIPPHSGSLSDLVAPGQERIGLTLIMNDANELSYQARLKVTIEGQGITLTSSELMNPVPITLSYGVPTLLSGTELREYFDLNNLIFSGYTRDQYIQNGGLPEGFYTICITAYDYDRSNEEALSLSGCTSISAILQDPPVIIAPLGAQLATSPQNVGVQWQERHVGGFPVQYTFQIFAYDPTLALTPDLIFDFEQPLVEKVVNSTTTTIIDPSDPPLIQGQQYIMRVRAEDLTMMNSFENNGWSAPEYFTFGEACSAPQNVAVTVLNETQAQIAWTPRPGFNRYVVRYREYGRTDANWYEDETLNITHTISDLLDGVTYEYQVQAICGGTSPGDFSVIDTFSTEAIEFDAAEFDCTDEFTLPTPENENPIAELEFGTVVNVGGFDFMVTQADPSDEDPGAWSGTGIMTVPWLGLKIICEFDGLFVNELNEVYDGEITAMSEGLESIDGYVSPEEVAADLQTNPPTLCGEIFESGGDDEDGDDNSDDGSSDDGDDGGDEEEEDNYVSNEVLLAHLGGVMLPVNLGEAPNMIAVDAMSFTPNGATLSAFMSAEIPVADQYVAFGTTTAFHPGGLLGESNLTLLNDIPMSIGDKILLNIKASDNTFVAWNCEGLSSIGIEGEVVFCRDLIVPVDPDSFERLDEGNVTASFNATLPEWGDLVTEISLSPFELPQLKDWAWTVENAVFDFSDAATPESVVFPEDYSHADVESEAGEDNPLWMGFFLGAVNVKMPEQFSQGDPDNPTQFAATEIIIDATGFSGSVMGTNVLSVENGRVGSWGFGIDSVGITVQSSQFVSAGMEGLLDVPAFESPLAYGCLIQPDEGYFFSIALTDDVEMDAWRASLTLTADTELSIEYSTEEESFTAGGIFHGSASFSPSVGSNKSKDAPDKMTLPTVNFENFELSTEAPYLVNIGYWELVNGDGEQPLLSGFPLTINELSLGQDGSEVAFTISAAINLVGEGDSGFAATGGITLLSSIEIDDNGKQVWTFEGVEVDELTLDVSAPGYSLYGSIIFYEDTPGYGSGFRAMIEAVFEPSLAVEAVVQFGEVDGFRYWFADAMASFEPGILIGTTGLSLYGFGGGASYHMTRGSVEDLELPLPEDEEPEEVNELIGQSLSGVSYIPDEDSGIGIRARVAIGLTNKETFNAALTFEILFNTSGGISMIGFIGDARFLTPPDTPGEDPEDPALRCYLDMNYDFENSAFHAQLDIYVNAVGGLVTGAYDENLAGTGIIHADPDLWYIHLGTPDNRVMLSYELSALEGLAGSDEQPDGVENGNQINWGDVGLLLTAYLDAGMNLPPFPPVPDNVKEILGEIDDINTDDPRFANGMGLMFGASMELNIPEITFLAFYASFSAGAGYDVMMINLGTGARCAGNENSADPIGINGWYAMGQVWAYVEGEIGMEVDVFGISGKYEILSIAAAAVLQAKLPNPMWMKGVVGGSYRILDGLVKGNCRFEFELGQKCDIVGADALAGIQLIGSTIPNDNMTDDVDVFTRPQATFNIPLGSIFELKDDNGDITQYKASLYQFDVTNTATGEVINGEFNWNDENDVVVFTPSDILAGLTEFEMVVVVRFDKRAEGTVTWSTLLDGDNNPLEQRADITFITGEAPDYIPHINVEYSYPVINQFNFLASESNQGYVQLKQGQDYLFKGDPSFNLDPAEWDQKLAFYQNGTEVATSSFTYNNSSNRIAYTIPSAQLTTNAVTQISLVNIPLVSNDAVDANVTDVEQELLSNQTDDSDTEYTNIILEAKIAEGALLNAEEEDFYTAHFRTSYYTTFTEKINALDFSEDYFELISLAENTSLVMKIFGAYLNGNEHFDLFDQEGYFNGDYTIDPLVQMEADLSVTGDDWYDSKIFPNMYQHLPVNPDIVLSWRDTDILGLVPSKNVFLSHNDASHQLTESDVTAGTFIVPTPRTKLNYRVPYTMYKDYVEYKQEVIYYDQTNPLSNALENFMNWNFAGPDEGTYRVDFKYVLPGAMTPNSTQSVDIIND